MSTTVRATGDPAEFKATVFPFLQADPVLHSTLLTNTEDRIRGILHDPAPPVFLSIHRDDDEVVGAVLCTALRGVCMGALPETFVPAIVDVCLESAPDPTVVEGTAAAARLLADLIAERLDKSVRPARGTRLHKLERFVEQKAEGGPRLAGEDDLEVATSMIGGYGADLGRTVDRAEDKRWVEARIERGRLWLWEDEGRAVSLVGHQNEVFGATRVGPVYTPDADRGHGYASALTAHVTQRILASGSEACLFTDLANPTSNKIYAAIGYRPVADFQLYKVGDQS